MSNHTNLRLGVNQTDSMLVDGDQQDLWVVGLCGLLKTKRGSDQVFPFFCPVR